MEHYFQGHHDLRNVFEKDYDRLIFSPSFRRLQNKTQVFPLPGSVFVHNRLTHSLEVSCVGRSLGYAVLDNINPNIIAQSPELKNIPTIVSTACLAHDLGNPPFGHSGETAISTYFSEGNGNYLKDKYDITDEQWSDFVRFDGNANAFRMLTHAYCGRRDGGLAMTYSSLASIVKYPYASINSGKKPKFGYFCSEQDNFKRVAAELNLVEKNGRYQRYPLVYLVEAADDICYQVMDIEDACKLSILSFNEVKQIFYKFLSEEKQRRAEQIFLMVTDPSEQLSYLRSIIIGILVEECAQVFSKNEDAIFKGEFNGSLIDSPDNKFAQAYKETAQLSVNKIYRSQVVLDVELAGYKIITDLLDIFINAAFAPEKEYSKKLLNRVPSQYDVNNSDPYTKIMAVLDFMSSMTDVYALDLYRKISGASLPTI